MQNFNTILEVKPMGFFWDTIDPFLFCVHHEDLYPKGNEEMGPAAPLSGRNLGDDFIIKDGWRMYHGKTIPGFPGHPHRGFETITIVRQGIVDHADSTGAAGRYGGGDVQWMTAGSGVQHSEMFPLIHKDKENTMEMFQIWLNLPKKDKMAKPHFKMLWSNEIPRYKQVDDIGNEVIVEVIAGALENHKAPLPPPDSWALPFENEVAIFNIHLDANANIVLPKASPGINRMLYFYTGNKIEINGESIANYHSIRVDGSSDLVIKNFDNEAKILLLQGKPINETVIQYGPFVMNSKEEIQQAFEEFHSTRFGGWPWSKYDEAHDRSLGRFAKHADGRYEYPD